MAIVAYPVVVRPEGPGGYEACFPDLPGVAVSAQDMRELVRHARERLAQELTSLESAGREWPEPTMPEAVRDGLHDAQSWMLIVDVHMDEAPMRVNISLGDRLLRRIDSAATALNMTRSGYLALAARRQLGDEIGSRAPHGERVYEEILGIGKRVSEALGPESAVGRIVGAFDHQAMDGLRRLGAELKTRQRPKPSEAGQENAAAE